MAAVSDPVIRVDAVDDRLISAMKRAGCHVITLGDPG